VYLAVYFGGRAVRLECSLHDVNLQFAFIFNFQTLPFFPFVGIFANKTPHHWVASFLPKILALSVFRKNVRSRGLFWISRRTWAEGTGKNNVEQF
jgi:hypothetical protein